MKRRDFIAIAGGAVAWPLAAQTQQLDRVRRLGVLMGWVESDPAGQAQLKAFRASLTKLGWTQGDNLKIEVRWAGADPDRTRMLAKELVGMRPDAILSATTLATGAVAQETHTIPIVFAIVADPIGNGFVASLAKPGGNMTGFTSLDPTIGGKWIELLKEIAPRTVRVVLLFNPATAMPFQFLMPSIDTAASSFAVEVKAAPVRDKEELEKIISTQAHPPGLGLVVMPDVFNTRNRDLIIALAAKYGVPAIYFNPTYFAEFRWLNWLQ